MKKLLFITAFPPNSKSGGEIFTKKTIENLSREFMIDLIYFSFPGHDCEANEYINKAICFSPSNINCIKKPTFYPLFTRRFNKKILHQIKDIASEYDVLFFEYAQTAIYSLYIEHPYKIIRAVDVIYQKVSRQKPYLKFWVKNNERKILKSANKVLTFCNKDDELIKDLYNIDSSWTNEYVSEKSFQMPLCIEEKKSFVFFGYWGRPENTKGLLWFIKDVVPLLDSETKKCLFVMGGGLSDENKKILSDYGITYLGFVENSYEAIVNKTAVIVPLFEGAGIKVKVLDSFITGTPVIGTDVAFEGIPDINGLTYLSNTADEFANVLNNFSPLTLREKNELRKNFIDKFGERKITDFIKIRSNT